MRELPKRVNRRLDLLINNAAVYTAPDHPAEASRGPLEVLDPQAVRFIMETNVLGALRVTKALVDRLKRPSVILNVSSSAASNSGGTRHHVRTGYAMSKAALNRLGTCLAAELAPRDVTVVNLDPGWMATDMGGPDAPRSSQEVAVAIGQLVAKLGPEDSGTYIDTRGKHLAF